jgi:hypothetical protein
MRALFAYLLAIGICLASGYAEFVWLAKPSDNPASPPHRSEDNARSEGDRVAHERSSTSAALDRVDKGAMSREAIQSKGRDEQTSAVSTVESSGDHQTTGLGHYDEIVNSLPSRAPSEPHSRSGSNVGPTATSAARTVGENDPRPGKTRRGSQKLSDMHRQRFSELLKHPLELRCITCVLFNP